MDTWLALQLVVDLFGIYATYIMAKVAWQAITGKWTGMSKENGLLALLIAILFAVLFIMGLASTLTEFFQKAP